MVFCMEIILMKAQADFGWPECPEFIEKRHSFSTIYLA